MIASYVSHKNDCHFCHTSHGAAAAAHLSLDMTLVDDIKLGFITTDISPKMRTLLKIAEHVQQGGKKVTTTDIENAKSAADGLGTWAPVENEAYAPMGQRLAMEGYVSSH